MKDRNKHMFIPQMECMTGLNCTVDEQSLLLDIKALINEYYLATFVTNGKSLKIAFNNGQEFLLNVQKIK